MFKQKVLEDYWPKLKPIIPKFFKGIDVKPSLLHGNFRFENIAESNLKPGIICINTLHNIDNLECIYFLCIFY